MMIQISHQSREMGLLTLQNKEKKVIQILPPQERDPEYIQTYKRGRIGHLCGWIHLFEGRQT
jgi:hypothetical protein